ncbi:MAG: U32 family peptidase [Oscillospiraceae bacterium]|nr:U32 family peptidase [Oscillospiraceae bacterium]
MIEILAPAGGTEALKAALYAGADAVYLGLHSFSARHNAENFNAKELYEAARECRLSGVRLYLTLNTLVFDDEIPELRNIITTAKDVGVDAIIVQDLGVLSLIKEIAPEIKLHASTQTTVTSVSGARAAKKAGFSRVVLARELSFSEIADISRNTDIETEVFVHGALCTCVSGQCYMSVFFGGRSANRGLCAQPCRLNFKADGDDYALSLKDLSVIKGIKPLEEAGVTSVKIEGRMKRPEYVAAAVCACRKARAGEVYDEEVLESVFSRSGFTDGYYSGETHSMRGYRGREDVIKTESVLKQLKNLYKEPIKRRELNISLVIKANEKVNCRAFCDNICINLEFQPAETAVSRTTMPNEVTAQLLKLGGTLFYGGEIKCEIEEGCFISVGQINKIRRTVVSEISERLRAGK